MSKEHTPVHAYTLVGEENCLTVSSVRILGRLLSRKEEWLIAHKEGWNEDDKGNVVSVSYVRYLNMLFQALLLGNMPEKEVKDG